MFAKRRSKTWRTVIVPQPVNQIDAFRALGFWFAKLLQQTLDEEGAANEKLN